MSLCQPWIIGVSIDRKHQRLPGLNTVNSGPVVPIGFSESRIFVSPTLEVNKLIPDEASQIDFRDGPGFASGAVRDPMRLRLVEVAHIGLLGLHGFAFRTLAARVPVPI